VTGTFGSVGLDKEGYVTTLFALLDWINSDM
jgi:hypothetical protein